jgi:hypothetical protein
MDQFNQIGHDYVSRNFNDRRPGAKFNNEQYPKGGNHRPDAGGSTVVAKPKKPKPNSPMSAIIRAV